MEQVVEIADVRQTQTMSSQRGFDASRAIAIEWLAEVERIRDRIEHRLGRHVGLGRMQRRGQLDLIRADLAGERDPVLDRAVRIPIAHVARRELLDRGRQDADFHELRFERSNLHQLTAVQTPPRVALASIASTRQLAR
jgi:hypothetical protein